MVANVIPLIITVFVIFFLSENLVNLKRYICSFDFIVGSLGGKIILCRNTTKLPYYITFYLLITFLESFAVLILASQKDILLQVSLLHLTIFLHLLS